MSKSLYQTNVESRAPLTTDTGVVGNWWVDTSASPADLYLCTGTTGGVYTWTKQGGGSGGGVQQDTSANTVAKLYTALEALRTAGKTILSIEFTPSSSNIILNCDNMTTSNITTPSFTFTAGSSSRALFNANQDYVLNLGEIKDDTYVFYVSLTNAFIPSTIFRITSAGVIANHNSIKIGSSEITFESFNGNIGPTMNSYVHSYTINYI